MCQQARLSRKALTFTPAMATELVKAQAPAADHEEQDEEYAGPIAKPRAAKSSQYRGVSKTVRGKWQARLCVQSTQRNLGCSFTSPEEAAKVWDAAAILHFGHGVDPKMLNFPEEYRPNDLEGYHNYLLSVGALAYFPDQPASQQAAASQVGGAVYRDGTRCYGQYVPALTTPIQGSMTPVYYKTVSLLHGNLPQPPQPHAPGQAVPHVLLPQAQPQPVQHVFVGQHEGLTATAGAQMMASSESPPMCQANVRLAAPAALAAVALPPSAPRPASEHHKAAALHQELEEHNTVREEKDPAHTQTGVGEPVVHLEKRQSKSSEKRQSAEKPQSAASASANSASAPGALDIDLAAALASSNSARAEAAAKEKGSAADADVRMSQSLVLDQLECQKHPTGALKLQQQIASAQVWMQGDVTREELGAASPASLVSFSLSLSF